MTKSPFPPPQAFPVQQNATTVGPGITTLITPSPAYQAKTRLAVLTRDDGGLHLAIYRASSTAPGFFSCEVHDVVDGKWRRMREEKVKYDDVVVPHGAVVDRVGDWDCWTLQGMTAEERESLRQELLQARTCP